jgi:hypothetical protein
MPPALQKEIRKSQFSSFEETGCKKNRLLSASSTRLLPTAPRCPLLPPPIVLLNNRTLPAPIQLADLSTSAP